MGGAVFQRQYGKNGLFRGQEHGLRQEHGAGGRPVEGRKNAAKSAKIWIIASAVVGLIVEVIYIIFAFIGGVGGYYYY